MARRDDQTGRLGHRTIAAAAADELRRRILVGEFPEGSQLRQDALSKDFGISRIPVREALVQLEAEGLVRIFPHRGAVVAELSLVEIDELFGLRALLEPRLLRHSAPKLTATDYARLDEILAEYDVEMRAHHVARWGQLNTALHSLLYLHAKQPRTQSIVQSLLHNTERYTRMQLAFTDGLAQAQAEHERLIDHCRKDEIEPACMLLGEHIENARSSLMDFVRLRSTGGPTARLG